MISRKNKHASNEQISNPSSVTKDKCFFRMPNSPASNFVLEVLGAGADIPNLPQRKKQVARSTEYEVTNDAGFPLVSMESRNAKIEIEISDIDKLAGSNKAAKKFFVFTLMKINEQALYDGKLTRDYISFSLEELVNIGFYQSVRSARTGFLSAMGTLTSIKICGSVKQSKQKQHFVKGLSVLFTESWISKGRCYVRLNYAISWSFLLHYFTILPHYYFRLPNRAADLLYYIFYLARQHTRELERQGYFTISLRAIQQKLQLPDETGNNNPARTIRQPIEDAVQQITDAHNRFYPEDHACILTIYSSGASITDYLIDGYLRIAFTGIFQKTFVSISRNTAEKIEASQKRRAHITEMAIASNKAKALRDTACEACIDNTDEQGDF